MGEKRKLAAILAADAVGFSRLTGADEDRTLARLRALRSDLIDPTIAVHNGRVFKRTGDGALVEFRSVVDAVRCAIEVQNAMVERNAGVAHDRRIEFRIGIHVGEVVEESDGDMMGDSVNIAARLEGIAKPGAICLSEQAYWQVKARLDIAVSDLGATQLKNIAEPVRAFSLQVGLPAEARLAAPAEPRAAERPAERPALSSKPSIAVLPFQNMSGDAEQEYFCDGLVEDIITTLSKLDGLRVIARNSSFVYKGRSVDVREAAQQLGVRYVLEGSVRRSGARIRVTAQLIDAADGSHLWAERYDRAVHDIFAIQDEITLVLATEMQVKLTDGEQARMRYTTTSNVEAWTHWPGACPISVNLRPGTIERPRWLRGRKRSRSTRIRRRSTPCSASRIAWTPDSVGKIRSKSRWRRPAAMLKGLWSSIPAMPTLISRQAWYC